MIQRKQTLYLMAAIILTVICLCMQIGSFKAGGLEVARVYNLWFTDPFGKAAYGGHSHLYHLHLS